MAEEKIGELRIPSNRMINSVPIFKSTELRFGTDKSQSNVCLKKTSRVAPLHCRLHVVNNRATIFRSSEKNSIFLNNRPVAQAILKDGDKFILGDMETGTLFIFVQDSLKEQQQEQQQIEQPVSQLLPEEEDEDDDDWQPITITTNTKSQGKETFEPQEEITASGSLSSEASIDSQAALCTQSFIEKKTVGHKRKREANHHPHKASRGILQVQELVCSPKEPLVQPKQVAQSQPVDEELNALIAGISTLPNLSEMTVAMQFIDLYLRTKKQKSSLEAQMDATTKLFEDQLGNLQCELNDTQQKIKILESERTNFQKMYEEKAKICTVLADEKDKLHDELNQRQMHEDYSQDGPLSQLQQTIECQNVQQDILQHKLVESAEQRDKLAKQLENVQNQLKLVKAENKRLLETGTLVSQQEQQQHKGLQTIDLEPVVLANVPRERQRQQHPSANPDLLKSVKSSSPNSEVSHKQDNDGWKKISLKEQQVPSFHHLKKPAAELAKATPQASSKRPSLSQPNPKTSTVDSTHVSAPQTPNKNNSAISRNSSQFTSRRQYLEEKYEQTYLK